MYLHAVLLLFLSWLLLLAQPTVLAKTVTANIADVTSNSFLGTKPDCQPKCGSLSVPYPFGIGAACSLDSNFIINCSNSEPFLDDLVVLSISPTQVRVRNVVASKCYNKTGDVTNTSGTSNMSTLASPYTYSDTANKFMVIGCNEFGQILGFTQDEDILDSACGSVCSNSTVKIDANCTGIGCCQTDIHKGMKGYMVELNTLLDDNSTGKVWSFDKCSYAFMGEQDSFSFRNLSDLLDPTFVNRVPIVLDYAIGNQSCAVANNSNAYLCNHNTFCTDNTESGLGGYLCSCKDGYEGNPYLSPGCIDIDECEDNDNLNDCHEMQLARILQEILVALVMIISLATDVCALLKPHKSQ